MKLRRTFREKFNPKSTRSKNMPRRSAIEKQWYDLAMTKFIKNAVAFSQSMAETDTLLRVLTVSTGSLQLQKTTKFYLR
jgi:hypothetical protein